MKRSTEELKDTIRAVYPRFYWFNLNGTVRVGRWDFACYSQANQLGCGCDLRDALTDAIRMIEREQSEKRRQERRAAARTKRHRLRTEDNFVCHT